jgi:hypothetical protein
MKMPHQAGRKMIMKQKRDRSAVVQPVPAVLYTIDEAALALRLSRSALYELIRSGRLRTVKSGR